MKNYLIALATLALTTSTFAATSGTLLLKGKVSDVVSIVVDPTADAVLLPLHTSQTDLKVAEVTERSNSATGYKVTISSANLGNLKRVNGSELFPYSLMYDGQLLTLSAPHVIPNLPAGLVNETKDVTIAYTGVAAENMVSGDYVDTVLFEIAVN